MTNPISAIADTLIDLHHINTDAGAVGNERAFNSVLQRLTDLDAFTGTYDDETGEHTVNVEELLVAIAGLQHYLIENLAEARHVDPETIRFELREFAAAMADD